MEIPDEEVWAARVSLRNHLFAFIRERARRLWSEDRASAGRVLAAGSMLDNHTLTLGFARGFTGKDSNGERETVYLKELLKAREFKTAASPLTIALGKDIAGRPVWADLAAMPHLLIAGATGTGKSVSIHAMLASILFKATANDVRFILIDPKMLELSVYEGIPHLLVPVVMAAWVSVSDW